MNLLLLLQLILWACSKWTQALPQSLTPRRNTYGFPADFNRANKFKDEYDKITHLLEHSYQLYAEYNYLLDNYEEKIIAAGKKVPKNTIKEYSPYNLGEMYKRIVELRKIDAGVTDNPNEVQTTTVGVRDTFTTIPEPRLEDSQQTSDEITETQCKEEVLNTSTVAIETIPNAEPGLWQNVKSYFNKDLYLYKVFKGDVNPLQPISKAIDDVETYVKEGYENSKKVLKEDLEVLEQKLEGFGKDTQQ